MNFPGRLSLFPTLGHWCLKLQFTLSLSLHLFCHIPKFLYLVTLTLSWSMKLAVLTAYCLVLKQRAGWQVKTAECHLGASQVTWPVKLVLSFEAGLLISLYLPRILAEVMALASSFLENFAWAHIVKEQKFLPVARQLHGHLYWTSPCINLIKLCWICKPTFKAMNCRGERDRAGR